MCVCVCGGGTLAVRAGRLVSMHAATRPLCQSLERASKVFLRRRQRQRKRKRLMVRLTRAHRRPGAHGAGTWPGTPAGSARAAAAATAPSSAKEGPRSWRRRTSWNLGRWGRGGLFGFGRVQRGAASGPRGTGRKNTSQREKTKRRPNPPFGVCSAGPTEPSDPARR